MRIGIDFDNTIADYERVFDIAARELGLFANEMPIGKNAIRDFLNRSGRNDEFTALQGHVYGARMNLVAPYPGVCEFITAAHACRHDLFVISHKTRYPIVGPAYDMHAAARAFLSDHGIVGPGAIGSGNVFFEQTKEEKIARAAGLGIDVLIDDLPEILLMPGLPQATRRILFSPSDPAVSEASIEICRSWREISDRLNGGS